MFILPLKTGSPAKNKLTQSIQVLLLGCLFTNAICSLYCVTSVDSESGEGEKRRGGEVHIWVWVCIVYLCPNKAARLLHKPSDLGCRNAWYLGYASHMHSILHSVVPSWQSILVN